MSLRRILAVLALTATVFVTPADAQTSTKVATYRITITNLSGQPLSPPVAALHTNKADFFEEGEAAHPAVAAMAEGGATSGLLSLAKSQNGVKAQKAIFSVIQPGKKLNFTIKTTDGGRRLSLLSMIECTNDGFIGLDSVLLPKKIGKKKFVKGFGFDAGSEQNVEEFDHWVSPCSPGASPNLHIDENGVITDHPGLSGFDDLDFDAGMQLVRVRIIRTA